MNVRQLLEGSAITGSALLIVGVIIGLVVGLNSVFVYFLWNWLAPVLFNLPTISFLQAAGLWILMTTLTGSGVRFNSSEKS